MSMLNAVQQLAGAIAKDMVEIKRRLEELEKSKELGLSVEDQIQRATVIENCLRRVERGAQYLESAEQNVRNNVITHRGLL